MVYRVSFRRIFFLATLLTSVIILYQIWPLPSLENNSALQTRTELLQIKLKELLIKTKLTSNDKQASGYDFAGNYLFADEEEGTVSQTEQPSTKQLSTTSVQTSIETSASQPALTASSEHHVTQIKTPPTTKLWFFKDGTIRPKRQGSEGTSDLKIWPHEAPNSDRIVAQLMYIPESYDERNVKTILIPNGRSGWEVPLGADVFEECPVSACTLTSDEEAFLEADAVLFKNTINTSHRREPNSTQVS